MTRQEEIAQKLQRVRSFIEQKGLDGLLLTKRNNFAWLTGGADTHVAMGDTGGIASLLVTKDSQYMMTNNIELPRLNAEEIEGLGFEPVVVDWYAGNRDKAVLQSIQGMKVGSDTPFGDAQLMDSAISQLHWSLLPPEIDRYTQLGGLCAGAMTESLTDVRPGMTEFQVAADVSSSLLQRGVEPFVVLIASDERIQKFRHPIAKDKKIQNCCMIVICGLRWGLVVSLTRLVNFGPLSDDLRRRHNAVVEVDAATIAASKPGATAGQVFSVLKNTYAKVGFPEEWRLHHQGGAAGYASRIWIATSEENTMPILENQAFAWNPSIAGTKSEDTIIATPAGPKIISPTPGIPTITVQTDVGPIERSDMLVM